jgi:23S rRNA A2030 N6-methylase RlmJ
MRIDESDWDNKQVWQKGISMWRQQQKNRSFDNYCKVVQETSQSRSLKHYGGF